MYNLGKKDIIQDEFGRPVSKFELFKQNIKNKLATIYFNEIKNNLGPSILFGAKTLGKWLVNALKFTYKYLPMFCTFILLGYLLTQLTLLIVNNIIPLFVDNFKGWIEFSNKLPYAFHTDLNGWIKFGRVILFFALTMSLHNLMEMVKVDLEDSEYPGLSYIVVLVTGLFITCLIIPVWFDWLCGLSALAFIGYIFFTGASNSEGSGSSGGGYSEDYKHETRRDERQPYKTETYEAPKTEQKTKSVVSANSWGGNSTMVHFSDGSRTAIPGYLKGYTGSSVTVTTDKAGKSFIIYEMKGSTLSRGRSWYQP